MIDASNKNVIQKGVEIENLNLNLRRLEAITHKQSQDIKQFKFDIDLENKKRKSVQLLFMSVIEVMKYNIMEEARLFLGRLEYNEDFGDEFEALMDSIQVWNVISQKFST